MENKIFNEKLFIIQHKIKNPTKDIKGFNYKYANLEQVLDLIKPFLLEHRILLFQNPINDSSMMGMETILQDLDSSEKYSTRYFIEVQKKDPQGYGSAITYLRRYSLLSMFNLIAEDDDGRAAMHTEDDNKNVLTEIRKNLKLIDDKVFVEKVESYISKNNDYKLLMSVLEKVQTKLKGDL